MDAIHTTYEMAKEVVFFYTRFVSLANIQIIYVNSI